MKVFKPQAPTIELNTAPEDDVDAWSPGTYQVGAQRIDNDIIYEAQVETTDRPSEGVNKTPKSWLKMGYINPLRALNDGVDSLTKGTGTLRFELRFDELADGLALLNMYGVSATVWVVDDIDGTVYEKTVEITDYLTDNWYDHWFAPYETQPDHVFDDLPPYIGAKIVIEINGSDENDPVAIGRIAAGRIIDLGGLQWGAEIGWLNASIYDRTGFNDLIYVPRRKVATVDYKVSFRTREFDRVKRDMDTINEPMVFIGSPLYGATVFYGVLRDARQILADLAWSDLSLDVEAF